MADPDERVAGSGMERLRSAGIEVDLVDDPAARDLDPAYFHHRETGMPLVTMKYAMTLDGAVAAADSSSRWITGEEARLDAHLLRSAADVVVVGAGTLAADDPVLDVRLPGYEGAQPRPVIVAGRGALPVEGNVWQREPIVVSTQPRELPSGELVVVSGDGEGRPDPVATCAALVELGHLAVLLEGGPTLAGAWWRAGVVARGVAYLGARLGGGAGMSPLSGLFPTIGQATDVAITDVRRIGADVRIDFEMTG
jgi:diaminohydroxyphosphoribosylaminopyrimidine deaminase/5-amino-6-(5-phosphoribosylamino)uracil reductase